MERQRERHWSFAVLTTVLCGDERCVMTNECGSHSMGPGKEREREGAREEGERGSTT